MSRNPTLKNPKTMLYFTRFLKDPYGQGRGQIPTSVRKKVKEKYNYRGIFTGNTSQLEMHHLIPRKVGVNDPDAIWLLDKRQHQITIHDHLGKRKSIPWNYDSMDHDSDSETGDARLVPPHDYDGEDQ